MCASLGCMHHVENTSYALTEIYHRVNPFVHLDDLGQRLL